MESVNKSFDVHEVFSGVEKSFEKYNSVDSDDAFEKIKAWKALSVEVVSGLTDILKNVLSKPKFEKSEIANRFCEFVDMISSSGNGALWSFASDENDGIPWTFFILMQPVKMVFHCYKHDMRILITEMAFIIILM